MDTDIRDLIRQLCTRAGMIMEDASAVAIVTPQEDRLDELTAAIDTVATLLRAAEALRVVGS